MLYLCAYYERDYPDTYVPLKQTYYGAKYRCGGPVELNVFELTDINELKGTLAIQGEQSPTKNTRLLWSVPYKNQKYVYVFKADAFSPYAPPPLSDNLSIKVALKMGLKLPQNVLDALKSQGVNTGGATGTGAPKPAVKKP